MANRQDFSRADRIRKAISREFSDIIRHEIQEPALVNQVISVTDVDVSGDLRHAKVFVSVLGDDEKQRVIMDILRENLPKIRSEIGRRIRLRYTPEIHLQLDDSLERGSRVTQLLNQISKGEV